MDVVLHQLHGPGRSLQLRKSTTPAGLVPQHRAARRPRSVLTVVVVVGGGGGSGGVVGGGGGGSGGVVVVVGGGGGGVVGGVVVDVVVVVWGYINDSIRCHNIAPGESPGRY